MAEKSDPRKRVEIAEEPGRSGEGDGVSGKDEKTRRPPPTHSFGKRWHRFRVLTGTSAILRGSYAMSDPRFKYRSRGRQAAPCSVVAIVYGRLFEPKEWVKDYVDQILEYGDKLFRVSATRNHVKDNEYMKASLVWPEFYIGNYKILICVEESAISGNLFSETVGCPDFADGLRRFFKANDSGVVTAQGTSVAMWRAPDVGFLCFVPAPCDENGARDSNGVACILRFACMNDSRDHFLGHMDKRYDSRYCIDKVTILRVNEVGRGYVDRLPSASRLVVDKSVMRAINPVDIDENKMDCTKPVPKGASAKAPVAAKIHKEPLLITISNYSIDRRFATEPLVDQDSFDTGYAYDGMHVNVPSSFRELPGNLAILHGLTHEGSEAYKGKGAQNVANCVVAIATKKVHPVKTWLRPKLDEILALGDSLFADVRSEKPMIRAMTAADLDDTRVEVENRKMVIDADLITITGTLRSKVPGVLNLKEALQEFFLVNKEGVIETSSMAVAIWAQDDCVYLFDPRQCDGFGARIADERSRGGKGGKGGDTGTKVVGKCCVVRFPDSDALAALFLKNVDPAKKNDRFTIRHVTIVDDVPGTRQWNDFAPGTPGKTWVLRGKISNDDESFEDESRGVQGLAMPVVALVNAKETAPAKWTAETVDDTVREGDAYYNWCNPPSEVEETTERPFLVPNLRRHFYAKDRKVKFDALEGVVIGDMNAPPDGDAMTLEKGIAEFLDSRQYGIVEARNLCAAIWKVEEESKNKDKETVKTMYYYYFDPNPRNAQGLASTGDEGDAACVVRTPDKSELAKLIRANAGTTGTERGDDFYIHEVKNISVSGPMSEEELEADRQIPMKPELYGYSSMGDSGAILLGSFGQANETMFKRHTRDKQQAAVALAALGTTKLYNPHLWYREVVDDILKVGDKITSQNLENLPEAEEADEETPRDYLLPSEIGEEFAIGVNRMSVGLEEEVLSGRVSDLPRLLEQFFESYTMGIFRQDATMIPVWKEGNVFFMLDPRGRDSRGEPREKDGAAAVMWFTDTASLALAILPAAQGEDAVIDNVTVENAFETRVAEMERVKKTTSGDELWHHFPKLAENAWSIGGNVTMADERFDEANRGRQTAAIAVMAIVFSKVYQPRYWTSAILDEVIVTGDKLHAKCVERLGERASPRVNEVITEFFLSSRRIDLTINDCVEAGNLNGKPPKVQDLRTGVDNFFRRYSSGVLTTHGSRNIAIWKFNDVYYCLIPDWAASIEGNVTVAPRVLRFAGAQLLVDYLLDHLGREGDYEITAIDVVDWNKLPPWKFDPSPAVRPSNLPPLNAYRRLQGGARAILRGSYHQGDEIFPEALRNKQTAANCVVSLGMAVIKSPVTWTKRTMDEILAIGSGVHRETKKAKPTKLRLYPADIIRVFHVGVNILTADIEPGTVSGLVAIPPPDPEDKKKKKKKKGGGKKRSKSERGRKKGKTTERKRAPPPPPILLEDGLRKFFENNRAGVLVTGHGMVAIWKDMGVYFMYDPRARSEQGLADFYGASCVMWFACVEPFYEVIFANIDEREKYGQYEICRVIVNTAQIEPLPCPAGFRPYFDCTAPPIPVASAKKATTLAVEMVTDYHRVDEELCVLRGTLHMSHRTFAARNRGLQSTAIAAVAIVVGLLHVPSTWTPELVDAVLKYGDSLHTDTVRAARPGARNLSPSELLTVFIVGDFRACVHVHNHTTAGLLLEFDLVEALTMFFRSNCAGILHTTNMAVAVTQHYGKFYLFDPCSRNEQGRPSFEGAACLMKFDGIRKLAKVFVSNCNLKKPNVYTLNAVNVLSLHFFSDAGSGCPPKCEQ